MNSRARLTPEQLRTFAAKVLPLWSITDAEDPLRDLAPRIGALAHAEVWAAFYYYCDWPENADDTSDLQQLAAYTATRRALITLITELPDAVVTSLVTRLPDEVALRWAFHNAQASLERQEREALDAGAETGEVAQAIARSRAAMIVAAKREIAEALSGRAQ